MTAIKGKPGIAGFAERLVCVRKMRGLTQDQLGEKANLEGMQISHYETGERKPGIENLRAICLALNTSADYLLDSH